MEEVVSRSAATAHCERTDIPTRAIRNGPAQFVDSKTKSLMMLP